MKPLVFFTILLFLSCVKEQPKNTVAVVNEKALTTSTVKTVDYSELEDYLSKSTAAITVVNFWATWCKPCIKELPYFEKIHAKYDQAGVEVILVSLDFLDQIERLEKFIAKRNLKSEVVLLDDPDANSWINKIDKSWSGAIPATIIFNQKKKSFYERSFTFQELEKEIEKFKL